MLRLLTTHACVWCAQNKALATAALDVGEMYQLDVVRSNTAETDKAAQLGLGLPVLVRDDGAMSKDAKAWKGAVKGKVKDDNGQSKNLAGVSSGVSPKHQDVADQSSGQDAS